MCVFVFCVILIFTHAKHNVGNGWYFICMWHGETNLTADDKKGADLFDYLQLLHNHQILEWKSNTIFTPSHEESSQTK